MSMIYIEKLAKNKRFSALQGQCVYKNALNALAVGVFSAFGVCYAQVGPASQSAASLAQASLERAAPMTLEQATAKSVETGFLDPTAAKERNLRSKAMQEAAQSFGARSGLMRRTYEINQSIQATASHLDAIWNFQPLMLTDAQPGEGAATMRQRLIVPAVIIQAHNIFKQDSTGLIRFLDATYKIESQPRFSSVTPSWRDYLFRDLGESTVNPPHVSLLPRTSDEKTSWNTWIAQGWESGITQANSYLDYDLNRLKRDRDGMITYHEMVAKKMVTLPHVATSNQAVTGDATTMNINDSMLRITVMPSFQRDSKAWTALQHAN